MSIRARDLREIVLRASDDGGSSILPATRAARDPRRDEGSIRYSAAALPTWGYSRKWGYAPTGGLGLVLVILLILVLFNVIPRGF
jgi:hypothetical protein